MDKSAANPPCVQPKLAPGTTIGHYRVEQLISSGGFGVVYRVSRDGQQFALKLPLPVGNLESPREGVRQRAEGELDDHCAQEQRIIREVVSLMTLSHPNIVRVHGFDRWPSADTGALYLVMDFVEGVPLLEWRRNERPTIREVVRLFQTLALALDQMHRLGVVHRDIKSSNILVSLAAAPRSPRSNGVASFARAAHSTCASRTFQPVLVDFGLARPAFTTDVTKEYVLLGTEGLWAPEHAAFGEKAFTKGARFKFTPATDLHALGLLFYQALTGRRALVASSSDFAAVVTEVVRPPSTVAALIPQFLDGPMLRLLAKKPEERPVSGAALSVELEALLAIADERWDAAVPPCEPPSPAPEQGPTTPQRPDRLPPGPKGPQLAPADVKPPLFVARSSEVVPAEPSPPADRSTTVRLAVPAPPRKRLPHRRVVVAVACVVALGSGTAVGLLSGALTASSTWLAGPPAHVGVAPEAATPSNSTPGRAMKTPAGSLERRAAATSSSSVSRTDAQLAINGKSSERTVVRAGMTGPVRVGAVEAVLREPVVSRGRILLPAGTAIVGAATPLEDGGFSLSFDTARAKSGATTPVDGSARLDARAGNRQPLRPGSVPQQFEFDLLLVTSR